MIGLLQRVARAAVSVEGYTVGEIGPGLLVLIGVRRDDTETRADRLLERLLDYRIFEDPAGKMNLSLRDTGGDLLLVPQFTLAADTRKGRRPSFSTAAPPALAEHLFDYLQGRARSQLPALQSGRFGADMQVSLVNDGPVTIWLES